MKPTSTMTPNARRPRGRARFAVTTLGVAAASALLVAVACGHAPADTAATPQGANAPPAADAAAALPPLRDAFKGKFQIGAAVDYKQLRGEDPRSLATAQRHFDALTPGNSLKPDFTQPAEGKFTFDDADKLVEIAQKSGAQVVGHTLVWHSQTPKWFFEGEGGNPPSREVALARMRKHIATVVGRYKGRIAQWDVVNEALSDAPDEYLRPTPWLKAIGPDYIEQAFRAAHEADPKAILIYNDYNIERNYKRPKAIRLIKELLAKKVPVHAVGIQGHWRMDDPDFAEVEASIKEFAALGLPVMITELDIGVLPTRYRGADVNTREEMTPEMRAVLNPYTGGLPDDVAVKHAERYREAFEMFLRNREHIDRVTLWGVEDTDSWFNNFPIRGRTDYPLLFDRQGKPKPAFFAVRDAAIKDTLR